jgi:hypothetical protein
MSSSTPVSSNFSVAFEEVQVLPDVTGSITLETDSSFSSSTPGAAVRFYLFKSNKIKSVQLFSTLGNISYVGSVNLPREDKVAITSTSPISLKTTMTSLDSIDVVGSTYNYAGLKEVDGTYVPVKQDDKLDYILASLIIKYTAIAEHYELTHTIPTAHKSDYEINVLAVGTTN